MCWWFLIHSYSLVSGYKVAHVCALIQVGELKKPKQNGCVAGARLVIHLLGLLLGVQA